MTTRSKAARRFIMLPADWIGDAQLIKVPAAARALFIGMVTFAFLQQSNGRVDAGQIPLAFPAHPKWRPLMDRLEAENLVVRDPSADCWWVADGAWWGLRQDADGSSTGRGNQKSAAQKVGVAKNGEEAESRARAHVKKEREKEREPIRSPSGSDRIGSARTAPRGDGSAAQPAPEADSPPAGGFDKLGRSDAIAAARAEIEKGRRKNPAATGRNVSFSKYDPDRPIVPLISALEDQAVAE